MSVCSFRLKRRTKSSSLRVTAWGAATFKAWKKKLPEAYHQSIYLKQIQSHSIKKWDSNQLYKGRISSSLHHGFSQSLLASTFQSGKHKLQGLATNGENHRVGQDEQSLATGQSQFCTGTGTDQRFEWRQCGSAFKAHCFLNATKAVNLTTFKFNLKCLPCPDGDKDNLRLKIETQNSVRA